MYIIILVLSQLFFVYSLHRNSSLVEGEINPINISIPVLDDGGGVPCENEYPCQNGGTCEPRSERDYVCTCTNGFTGKHCEIIEWCKKNQMICGNAPCRYDMDTESGFCSCDAGFYFDPKRQKCVELDKCLFQRIIGNCIKDQETCDSRGNCICEENYAYSYDKSFCKTDFCKKNSKGQSPCGENMECIETPEYFFCFCKKGFRQFGKKCEKINYCTPGISMCQQKCRNGACFCFSGFRLNADGYTCERIDTTSECSLDCGRGTCIKEGNIERCMCPEISHVSKDNTCIDKCSAASLTKHECPTDAGCVSDEYHGYKCNCTGKYEFEEDGIHCKAKHMCNEWGENEVCSTKNAVCKDNIDSPEGYTCECKFGYEMQRNGTCQHKCERRFCDELQALCVIDVENRVGCTCPPLLVKGSDGRCSELAKYSYIGNFSVPKKTYQVATIKDSRMTKKDTSINIDYAKLQNDFGNSMDMIFDGFEGSSILNCIDEGDDWRCLMEMKLKKDPKEKINILSMPSVCRPLWDGSLIPRHCVIPPEFIIRREFNAEVFRKTDPCIESITAKLCGKETLFKVSEQFGFKCECKSGYYRRISYVPAPGFVVDVCEDIDECLNQMICPNNTDCRNLPGDHTCECKDGYRLEERRYAKIDECRGLCDPNPCMNGVCEMTKDYAIYCRCNESFTGPFCQETIAVVKSNMSILFIGIVIFFVILILMLSGALGYVCVNRRRM